ncbi:GH3 auxin-responsive promoter [Gloeocapsa sp. PCC 7428]|uniref:GH3 auxin-responsive promoter family protein n=1 Tax=Gloeocapsa sp. PCC 7428 TaxID=1173026 RepID=UPI0002A5E166|nr:GH3 auxin-responsive promoter family protein [Gloeocapsa sp. PCC 7428]AFZ32947.1 GH3 auxin-responsive promoter [Gloeocapsa sp. PCC 7428]
MSSFVQKVLLYATQQRKNIFVKKTHNALSLQEQFLINLLDFHKNTELGKEYSLNDITTIEQFQQRIPIWEYSSYEPYIQRMAQGEKNILTPDPVVYFNTTSGSTGKQKLIPVTQYFQSTLRRANFTSIGFLDTALRSRNLNFGKLLVTNTAKITGQTASGIAYGPGGTGVIRMNKILYQQLFAHPYTLLEVSDSVSRHYLCLLFALRDESMRGMIANFPMLILRTCQYLERYAKDLIHDLEFGQIASWLNLEPEIRKTLEKQFFAVPSRAAQLKSILRNNGKLTPKLAWSNLSFIATARGGTSNFYFHRFPDYLEDTPIFGAVYASAEGTFSIYSDLNTDGSILAIESGFFEFIPQDQWEEAHPKTLLATEVKVGQLYRILMTNYSGLYRYDNGDVIEVVGFYNKTPLITFRYRRGGLLSSTTEKTTESHATHVMQALQQEFGLALEDFCITLTDNDFPAHYLVNIELIGDRPLSNPQTFLAGFDQKLKEINVYYGAKRRDQVPPPRLRILAPGSFAIIRQRQLQKGIPDSQLKFPHISEDRNFLSGLTIEQEFRLPEDV